MADLTVAAETCVGLGATEPLFVGCCSTGYIVVPDSDLLRSELEQRCVELGREAASWVRVFRLRDGASTPVHDV